MRTARMPALPVTIMLATGTSTATRTLMRTITMIMLTLMTMTTITPTAHHDEPAHDPHGHADHNLLAAYVHVLADAFTSVLAIVALVAGRYFGWVWLDAAMGIVGAAVILRWSYGLVRQTARVLLDSADPQLLRRVKERLERDGACVSDLHIWRLGPGHSAVVATVVCPSGNPPEHFKEQAEGNAYALARDGRGARPARERRPEMKNPTGRCTSTCRVARTRAWNRNQ